MPTAKEYFSDHLPRIIISTTKHTDLLSNRMLKKITLAGNFPNMPY